MTDHLSDAILNALADGELTAEQLAGANWHLAECPACTSNALQQTLLKLATKRAGQRYMPAPQLKKRLTRLASQADGNLRASEPQSGSSSTWRPKWGSGSLGWAAALILLVVSTSVMLIQRSEHRDEIASAKEASLITEVFDLHIATLADEAPLQVISTDRHTVKPWFQGKIPFSFNLPQGLPSDTTLDGANLTYMRNRPVVQLLYSIGKHRVSVFLGQTNRETNANQFAAERSGYHVMEFSTNDLNAIAISDVDPPRLADLVNAIRNAQ